MQDPPEDLTVVLLCGGAATRMGGVDKPLQPLDGEAMVSRVRRALPSTRVLISANRNLATYATYGEVVTDATVLGRHPKAQGPLVGILAALKQCTTQWLLVCPGDTPFIEPSWWHTMYAAGQRTGSPMVSYDGQRQQHLHVLLPQSSREGIEQFIAAGRHEVYLCLRELDAQRVTFDDPAPFRNINTLDELRNR
ncbi:MAG: molybdenum cofactor guanylyltransferase [Pseudomonadota bacterium]